MIFGSIEYRIQAAIRPNLGGRREEDASLFVSKPSPQLCSSTSDFRMLGLTPLIRFPASSDETQVHLRDVVVLKRQKETGRCKSEVFTGCIDAKLAELRDNGNPERVHTRRRFNSKIEEKGHLAIGKRLEGQLLGIALTRGSADLDRQHNDREESLQEPLVDTSGVGSSRSSRCRSFDTGRVETILN
jgi:hypothetical protein